MASNTYRDDPSIFEDLGRLTELAKATQGDLGINYKKDFDKWSEMIDSSQYKIKYTPMPSNADLGRVRLSPVGDKAKKDFAWGFARELLKEYPQLAVERALNISKLFNNNWMAKKPQVYRYMVVLAKRPAIVNYKDPVMVSEWVKSCIISDDKKDDFKSSEIDVIARFLPIVRSILVRPLVYPSMEVK